MKLRSNKLTNFSYDDKILRIDYSLARESVKKRKKAFSGMLRLEIEDINKLVLSHLTSSTTTKNFC